jgi:hypothetical protein
MAIRSPHRAWARARVAAHMREYRVAPGTSMVSVSALPFQSWNCRT